MGIMSYVSSPLWLVLLIVSGLDIMNFAPPAGPAGWQSSLGLDAGHAAELFVLVIATLALLYLPKFLAVAVLLDDAETTSAHGGTGAVLLSALWESLFSTLMAPIVMLQHSWFVLSILMGMATGWSSQQRTDRALPLVTVARRFWPHTLIGLVATVLLRKYAGDSFGWFVPLLAGMLVSIPLVVLTSSPLLGRLSRKENLFLTPVETRGLGVLNRAHALAEACPQNPRDMRRLVLDDAMVRELHLALLAGAPPPEDRMRLWALREQAARKGTSGFSGEDWALVLSDPESIKALGSPSILG